MHRDWLVRVIDGARLREIRSRIDPVLWRLMVEEMPGNAAHHTEPRVEFLSRMPRSLEADLLADGARTLSSLIRPEWQAVALRARLRFDAAWGDVPGAETTRADAVMALTSTWLVPRRLPQWAWLF
jgi:hypothetical protein